MDTRENTRRILIFLGLAYGIPWAAALAIALTSVWKDNPLQAVTLANLVFISTPVVANLATRLVTKEGWGHFMLRPNFRRGWRFYLAAWLLPLLAAVVGRAVFYLLFPQSFDPNLGEVRKLTASIPAAAAINPWLFMLSITLQIVFISVPINSVVSLGEELGWRAYLLPKLMACFAGAEHAGASGGDPAQASRPSLAGARRAALLVGLIHGVWHWPLFFLSTKLDPGSAFPFPLVYLVFTCSMSVLLSWATVRGASVWPAAIGHGAVNGTSALAGYLLKGPALPLLGPAPTGLIGGLAYLVLALALLFNRKAFEGRKAAA
jgi:membrane protease YdiL (CAAX protease family)